MNKCFLTVLAALVVSLGISAPANSAPPADCAGAGDPMTCWQQVAEDECSEATPAGPVPVQSYDCYRARSTYLSYYANESDNIVRRLMAQIAGAQAKVAALEAKVARQAATIHRLRDRLHHQR